MKKIIRFTIIAAVIIGVGLLTVPIHVDAHPDDLLCHEPISEQGSNSVSSIKMIGTALHLVGDPRAVAKHLGHGDCPLSEAAAPGTGKIGTPCQCRE